MKIMERMRSIFVVALILFSQALFMSAHAQTPPDIDAFFPKPKYGGLAVSPSGEFLAFPEYSETQHILLIVKTSDLSVVQRMPFDDNSITSVHWATDERILVSISHNNQSFFATSRLYAFNIDGSAGAMMFKPNKKLRSNRDLALVKNYLPDDPDHVIMYAYDRRWSLYKVNINTGNAKRIELGGPQTVNYKTNRQGIPVVRYDSYNRSEYVKISARAPGEKKWVKVAKVRYKDLELFKPIAATDDPSIFYVSARPEGYDRASIFKYDLVAKTFLEPLSQHGNVDLYTAIIDDAGNYVASLYFDDRIHYDFVDKKLDAHIKALNAFFDKEHNVIITDVSANRRIWILYVDGPREPGSSYIYDTQTKKTQFIVSSNYDLPAKTLSKTRRIDYIGRDGTKLHGYLTSPTHSASSPAPLLIMPHGGPQLRDYYEYDLMPQFFASRGYQVFQPNFRGSSGFGLAFEEAGYKKWGSVMIDDISDGTQHLIKIGKAQKNRICIIGASYGGYAALASAYRTPDLYQCSISINGVSDLMHTIKYDLQKFNRHKTLIQKIKNTIGDPSADKTLIAAQSPIKHVSEIIVPVLLIHGDADAVVPVEQSQAFHTAMQMAGKSSKYIELKDTDHNLSGADPEWREDWDEDKDYNFAFKKTLLEAENFLAVHLKP